MKLGIGCCLRINFWSKLLFFVAAKIVVEENDRTPPGN
jgi:hypothetical protein